MLRFRFCSVYMGSAFGKMVLSLTACVMLSYHHLVRKLPQPIPRNSVESDIGCTTRIYFDNVTLMFHNVTAAKQTFINEVFDFFNKMLLL